MCLSTAAIADRCNFKSLAGWFEIASDLGIYQKTREDCGCPKFLAAKIFRQISTLLENRFSGSAKCHPCQGLGTFRQGKWLLENRPCLLERSRILLKPTLESHGSSWIAWFSIQNRRFSAIKVEGCSRDIIAFNRLRGPTLSRHNAGGEKRLPPFDTWPCVRADFRAGDEDSNSSVFRVRRFSEWPEPLHWIAFPVNILTKPLIHWIASPFSLKTPFFHWEVLRRIPFPKIGSEKCLLQWYVRSWAHQIARRQTLPTFHCVSQGISVEAIIFPHSKLSHRKSPFAGDFRSQGNCALIVGLFKPWRQFPGLLLTQSQQCLEHSSSIRPSPPCTSYLTRGDKNTKHLLRPKKQ